MTVGNTILLFQLDFFEALCPSLLYVEGGAPFQTVNSFPWKTFFLVVEEKGKKKKPGVF